MADELTTGLGGLLGRPLPSKCCGCNSAPYNTDNDALLVSVGSSDSEVGSEGFTIVGQRIVAQTSSGALYGAFRFLRTVQQHMPLQAEAFTERPAMKLRAWNMWDTAAGRVEQGHDGNSLLWPYALYEDGSPPPRDRLYVATECNASDPYQQWTGDTFEKGNPSVIKNVGAGSCLTSMSCDPVSAGPCSGPESAKYLYNHTNFTISLPESASSSTALGHCTRGTGLCLDLNQGSGPDIDIWSCHGTDNLDYIHQRFAYNVTTRGIQTVRDDGRKECLTLLRSAPLQDATSNADDPWTNAAYKSRVAELLRLLKSAGMNTIVLNDVNACDAAGIPFLASPTLANWTRNLGPLLDKYAVTPMLSLCFAAPTELSNITSDPLHADTIEWWQAKFAEIYRHYPRFGGVVVKADSEGNIGPQSFNRTG